MGLEQASAPNSGYDFSRKVFLMLYSVNQLEFTVWLLLLLEILDNMCIVVTCSSVCDVINFETKLSVLINPFYDIKK